MEGTRSDLHHRLEAYDIANLGGNGQFERRLTKEQGWSPEFTRRVIGEYRRFLFLAATTKHAVSPSQAVDEVWHLHLLHTQEYWEHFCPNILQKTLHHNPARGTHEDALTHAEWYAQTIASYEHAFGALPPRDIWPAVYSGGSMQSRIRTAVCALCLTIVALVISLFVWQEAAHAFTPSEALDLPGREFLSLYVTLFGGAAGTSLIFLAAIFLLSQAEPNPGMPVSDTELGYLRAGNQGAALVCLAQLQAQGKVAIDHAGKVTLTTQKSLVAEPAAAAVLENVAAGRTNLRSGAFRAAAHGLREKLIGRGLLLGYYERRLAIMVPIILMGSLEIFGIAKCVIGVQRHRPISYLSILLFFGFMAIVWIMLAAPRMTRAGRALLHKQRSEHERLGFAPKADEIPLAAALFGATALGASVLGPYIRAQAPSTWAGGGCGGGGCGGGGCGGGGCGGCGS